MDGVAVDYVALVRSGEVLARQATHAGAREALAKLPPPGAGPSWRTR